MTHLELNPEEHAVLIPALERELSDLHDEISHTDSDKFKDMLKHRRIILAGILKRIQEPTAGSGPAG